MRAVLMRRMKQAFCLLAGVLTLTVMMLEAPELLALTNDVSNDAARIEVSLNDVLRSVPVIPRTPAVPPARRAKTFVATPGFKISPLLPPLAPVKAGPALLRLLVLLRE
jgi:hypothetical protein